MPEYLAPGVFVEEIDSGSKPIEGVGTNTAAFIGYAKSGEFNKPIFITNWTQFCSLFGEDENTYVQALCQELSRDAADIIAAKRTNDQVNPDKKGWQQFAKSAIEAAKKNWAEFVRKYEIPLNSSPYIEGSYLAHAVRGYYDNGGSRAYIVRVPRKDDVSAVTLKSNGHAALPAGTPAQAQIGPFTVKALKAGSAGNDIKVEVEPTGDGSEFKVKITENDKEVESFGSGSGKDKPLTPESFSTIKSKYVTVEAGPEVATATRLEAGVFTLLGGLEADEKAAAIVPVSPVVSDLGNLKADDIVGDEAEKTGIGGLNMFEDINMVCVPDLMTGLWTRDSFGDGIVGEEKLVLTEEKKKQILDTQCALVAYCERSGDRMAILDPIPGLTPQAMHETTMMTAYNCDHGQAAIYYPWIRIKDPTDRSNKRRMFVPPSGHIAGLWARTAAERGVHKAPANESLIGAVALETEITKGENELLNPIGVNCIRSFPGRGIRVWGARTLATIGNQSWKYVNVRRLFNYIEKSMERGLQWVVFEPNDGDLWSRVRRNLSAFLYTEWMEGKLFGSTPTEAFYVKCDAETNPQEMIDLGRLYVEIGINPVKPAEFVIIRMGQWNGGGSTSEE